MHENVLHSVPLKINNFKKKKKPLRRLLAQFPPPLPVPSPPEEISGDTPAAQSCPSQNCSIWNSQFRGHKELIKTFSQARVSDSSVTATHNNQAEKNLNVKSEHRKTTQYREKNLSTDTSFQ